MSRRARIVDTTIAFVFLVAALFVRPTHMTWKAIVWVVAFFIFLGVVVGNVLALLADFYWPEKRP